MVRCLHATSFSPRACSRADRSGSGSFKLKVEVPGAANNAMQQLASALESMAEAQAPGMRVLKCHDRAGHLQASKTGVTRLVVRGGWWWLVGHVAYGGASIGLWARVCCV